MKCDTRIHRYEFISLSFCSQLFKRNGFKYKKKKEAARIEYPAIRTTSFVSIEVYLQREQRVVYVYHISYLTLALGEKGVFNSYQKISMLHFCNWKNKFTLKQKFCSNVDLDIFSNNIAGTSYHLKGSLFKINPKPANDKKIIYLSNMWNFRICTPFWNKMTKK
jgi:hypothetical protein